MENKNFYNEVLTWHNMYPEHKVTLSDATKSLEGVNPSCGDDIVLSLKLDGNTIVDGGFTGIGCAISQASADIMLDRIIGKSTDEALALSKCFLNMIQGEADENELELLVEAGALSDISHMPSRVKCAVLAWHTLEEMLKA